MPRLPLRVRAATPADLPALLCLFDEMREGSRARTGRSAPVQREAAAERYRGVLADPDSRVLVAVDEADGGVLGMAVLTLGPVSTVLDAQAVLVSQLHVSAAARRRGAGRALVAAAAGWAEERGVEAVAVSVLPHSRDAQRFYARLGFAPLVVRRVAPLSVLRRRLGVPAAPPVPTGVGEALPLARGGLRSRALTARTVAAARRRAV